LIDVRQETDCFIAAKHALLRFAIRKLSQNRDAGHEKETA
jgi:hypothetical protein